MADRTPKPEDLARDWQRPVFNLACKLLGNETDAADATQEVFVQLFLSLPKYREQGHLKAWVYGVAANTIHKWMRNRALRDRKERSAMPLREPEQTVDSESVERQAAVQREVLNLSEDERMAVVLHYYNGLSQVEIAATLRVPRTTLQSRLARALDSLKAGLSGAGLMAVLPNLEAVMTGTPQAVVPASLQSAISTLAAKAAIGSAVASGITLGGIVVSQKLAAVTTLLVLLSLTAGIGIGRIQRQPILSPSEVVVVDDNKIKQIEAALRNAEAERDYFKVEIADRYKSIQADYDTQSMKMSSLESENLYLLAKLDGLIAESNRDKKTLQPLSTEDAFLDNMDWTGWRDFTALQAKLRTPGAVSPQEMTTFFEDLQASQTKWSSAMLHLKAEYPSDPLRSEFQRHGNLVLRLIREAAEATELPQLDETDQDIVREACSILNSRYAEIDKDKSLSSMMNLAAKRKLDLDLYTTLLRELKTKSGANSPIQSVLQVIFINVIQPKPLPANGPQDAEAACMEAMATLLSLDEAGKQSIAAEVAVYVRDITSIEYDAEKYLYPANSEAMQTSLRRLTMPTKEMLEYETKLLHAAVQLQIGIKEKITAEQWKSWMNSYDIYFAIG